MEAGLTKPEAEPAPVDGIRSCANCAYSEPAMGPDNKINFQHRVCKIRSPTLILTMTPQGPQPQPQWPVMGAQKVCGEHLSGDELEAFRQYRLRVWTGMAIPGEIVTPGPSKLQ
jgi:hypothetical protein